MLPQRKEGRYLWFGISHDTKMRALCLLLLVQTIVFGAAHRTTAADIVDLVYTSLYSDRDDERLAQTLRQAKMAEQLNPHLIQYFQSIGVGPHALAALQKLHDASALLPPGEMPLTIQPIPTPEEQKNILQRLVQYARSYVQNLPDFLCDQITHRYTNLTGLRPDGNAVYSAKLTGSDHFTRSLRFSGGVEQTNVVQPSLKTKDPARKSGQSITSGEFGGDLLILFGAGVNPQLNWDHWEKLRGQHQAVFHYFVGASRSQFTLIYCCLSSSNGGEDLQQRFNPAIQGLVYLDPMTGVISRLTIRAVHLPESFHIQESNTIIDYNPVAINGRSYILPAKALAFSRIDNGQKNRNEMIFTHYRKFETESVLTFGDSQSPGKGDLKK